MRSVFSPRGFALAAMASLLPALLPSRLAAADSPPVAPPAALTMSAADIGLDIRFDLLQDDAKGFALLEKEFARDPRPHVKARYAECLLGGPDWGAPAGQEDRGLALAQEALRDGSIHALRVVGWALLQGGRLPRDPVKGVSYLMKAAGTKNPNALCTVGDMYLLGVGMQVNLSLAESWFLQAAYYGKPYRLFRLGRVYEAGPGGAPPDLGKACDLYYEASTRGSGAAKDHLRELAAAGEPHALRAERLEILWGAAIGDIHTSKVVRAAAQALEKSPGDDLPVLIALGRLYASDHAGYRDFKKAFGFFDRAAKLGSLDARSERARLLAEGRGVKKDQALALAEWRDLEHLGNANAFACLGYYHYWGSLKGAQLPKDAALAFSYSKQAAEAGDLFGQMNLATCYEFGIGTPIDYALAAKFYWTSAWRGSPYAYEKVLKLINHVPH